METIILSGIVIVVALLVIIILKQGRGNDDNKEISAINEALSSFEKRLDRYENLIRDEFSRYRDESRENFKENREELSKSINLFRNENLEQSNKTRDLIDKKQNESRDLIDSRLKENRTTIESGLKESKELVEEKLNQNRETIDNRLKENRETIETGLKENRDLVENKLKENTETVNKRLMENQKVVDDRLKDIQTGNEAKLEEMRRTVDEKLQETLEKRISQSFKLVGDNLEKVQKGLVEMQGIAQGVGDLKTILSNVKSKGVFGEIQLEGILDDILTPNQYEKNVKTKEGSNDLVEFAIKIPSKESNDKFIYLPIDAKFPTEDYSRLMEAYEASDIEGINTNRKSLETKIKKFANDISTKYIDPPHTTDFGIMFLPFESLYAEVLRIPGLLEGIGRDYKVTITGPTTIAAFLNSLQMGFKSLAVEKRTSEIWEVLGSVKTEFNKFGEAIEKAKRKIVLAGQELDKTGVRTRAIQRKLRDVEALPEDDIYEDKDEYLIDEEAEE
ncbi:MAG: DNA recombination protein RmuC [Lachnospiraceae bacterium]|jgi:DNA recombination protein RmuC|nr:DNA recombination protein RmuC [Lachnospiraceae bacterium]